MRTPMSINLRLTKDGSGSSVDPTLHKNMISSLRYLTVSRSDICSSVSVCGRYQANLKESNIYAIKCVIRFVNETINDGICILKTLIQVLYDIAMLMGR